MGRVTGPASPAFLAVVHVQEVEIQVTIAKLGQRLGLFRREDSRLVTTET